MAEEKWTQQTPGTREVRTAAQADECVFHWTATCFRISVVWWCDRHFRRRISHNSLHFFIDWTFRGKLSDWWHRPETQTQFDCLALLLCGRLDGWIRAKMADCKETPRGLVVANTAGHAPGRSLHSHREKNNKNFEFHFFISVYFYGHYTCLCRYLNILLAQLGFWRPAIINRFYSTWISLKYSFNWTQFVTWLKYRSFKWNMGLLSDLELVQVSTLKY